MTEQISPHNGSGTGHLTDEDLAVLVDPRLSEPESTDDGHAHQPHHSEARAHLEICAPCRAAFEATERALEALRDPAAMHEPPAGLWDRIAAEIAATPEDHSPMASVTELRPRDSRRSRRQDGTMDSRRSRRQDNSRDSRRSRLWTPLAAAAAGAVIGGAAVAAWLGQEDSAQVGNPVAGPTVVGDAILEAVAADDFTGRAEMVEDEDGALQLTVEISAAPDPEAGYFEVWLRDEDGTQLISLGAATADSTTFTVPAGIDLSQYPVVDVSHEHFDGDPGHSGTTLAAGPMEDADS